VAREAHEGKAWLARAGCVVLGIVFLRLGFEVWWVGRIHEHLWVQVGVAGLYLAGLFFLLASVVKVDHAKLDKAGFLALCGALAFYALVTIRVVDLHYTSDALLFVHEASRLSLSGVNPYGADLVGGYEAFSVPYYVQTPTTSGGIVTNFNYPALSFLIYAPFVALGVTDLRIVSAGFVVALLGLIYLRAPRHLRLLALGILFLSSFFLAFCLSGFDVVFVFFLVAAMVLWKDRPGLAMVMFGLSAAVKQTVWFIAPFLLVRLWMESADLPRRERLLRVARLASYSAAAFAIPNAPYVLLGPKAWLVGLLTPVGAGGDTLVPLSQGLTVFFYTGAAQAPTLLLALLSVSALVAALLLYWRFYGRLREALWLAPAPVLAFAPRALQNYYEMFYPVALVALLSTLPPAWEDDAQEEAPA